MNVVSTYDKNSVCGCPEIVGLLEKQSQGISVPLHSSFEHTWKDKCPYLNAEHSAVITEPSEMQTCPSEMPSAVGGTQGDRHMLLMLSVQDCGAYCDVTAYFTVESKTQTPAPLLRFTKQSHERTHTHTTPYIQIRELFGILVLSFTVTLASILALHVSVSSPIMLHTCLTQCTYFYIIYIYYLYIYTIYNFYYVKI